MSNNLPASALLYLVAVHQEMSLREPEHWTDDVFAGLAHLLIRRNRFAARLAHLRAQIDMCLARDGKQGVLEQASVDVEKEMGQTVIRTADMIISFPPKELELEYRSLIYTVGAQAPIGAWSVLQFDLLTMFEDGDGLLTEIFPSIVSNHPQIVFDSILTDEQLIRYQSFFNGASDYFNVRSEKVQQEINSLVADQSIEAQAASGLLLAAWRALRVGIIIYKMADELADAAIEVLRKRQAEEAERVRAEQNKRIAREEMEKFVRENFRPAPNADRWLDKFERYVDYKRTA